MEGTADGIDMGGRRDGGRDAHWRKKGRQAGRKEEGGGGRLHRIHVVVGLRNGSRLKN